MKIIITESQKKKILEFIENGRVICDECGWSWDLSDGGDDPYICHKCGHNNSEEDYRGKRVMVYYNLHKHTFSVTYQSKVVLHADYVKLKDVEFRVRTGGKEKVRNEKRNRFIKNLALSLKGNTLLLFQYVEKHGKELYKSVLDSAKDRKVFFVYGGVEADEREEIRKLVENEKNAIIVASSGVFSTGVNIKNIHNIIFSSPSKSKIRTLQSIGRGLRTSKTKESVTLFDIADDLSWKTRKNFTLEHFKERARIYAEEGFDYKVYKVDL